MNDDLRDANEQISQLKEEITGGAGGGQMMIMGPGGVPQLSPTPNVQALMLQLRASEDGRMACLMELQRMRTQNGYDQEMSVDAKIEVEQIQDDLNNARDAKRRSELQLMELTTRLEEANTETRNIKRQVISLKRRLSQFTEEKKRSSQNLYAGMNMLTADQVAAGAAAAAAAGASDDGSGNAMMVQNMMNSPRNMVSMVGTMPQLPMGVLRVGNGGGFGIQNGVNGGIGMMQGRMGQMQGGLQGMQGMGGMGGMGGMQAGPSLWQQQNGGVGGGGGGPTIRTVVPETEADLSQGRRVSGRAKNDGGGASGTRGSGYSCIHSRDGGGKQHLSGSKPLRPSPKKSAVSNQSPQQRVVRPTRKNNGTRGRGGGRGGGNAVRGQGYRRR